MQITNMSDIINSNNNSSNNNNKSNNTQTYKYRGRKLRSAEKTIRTAEDGLSDYVKIKVKGFNSFLTGLIKERSKQE